jgi:hypothetical protein
MKIASERERRCCLAGAKRNIWHVLLMLSLLASGQSLQAPTPLAKQHPHVQNPSSLGGANHSTPQLVPITRSSAVHATALSAATAAQPMDRNGDEPAPMAASSMASKSSSFKVSVLNSFRTQLQRRIAADPNFVSKSFVEVVLAAGTQLIAEAGRRGGERMVPEIDFVVAGVLTAVAGKYYAMWRVAPTKDGVNDNKNHSTQQAGVSSKPVAVKEPSFWSRVPTNAFQDTYPDGFGGTSTVSPSLQLRAAAFLKPIPPLFRAGVVASALGYGLTSILIFMRSLLVPSYAAKTKMVNLPLACVYTGCFMAVVSNIRYQLLSGIVEPQFIDRYFAQHPPVQAVLVFLVRLANGILGSMLAITGMTLCGLQKLK